MLLLLDFISYIQPCIECLFHSGLNLYNLTLLSLLNVDLVWLEAEVWEQVRQETVAGSEGLGEMNLFLGFIKFKQSIFFCLYLLTWKDGDLS